jgi:hypothetical protein
MCGGFLGLNKPRTKLGKWLDKRGIKQEWLTKKSFVNKQSVSLACNDMLYLPSGKTMQKIIQALREVDPSVRADQFWDL